MLDFIKGRLFTAVALLPRKQQDRITLLLLEDCVNYHLNLKRLMGLHPHGSHVT
jgi:hypothetical protein